MDEPATFLQVIDTPSLSFLACEMKVWAGLGYYKYRTQGPSFALQMADIANRYWIPSCLGILSFF